MPQKSINFVAQQRNMGVNSSYNYDTLYPATLNIVPSTSIIDQWKADYENMQLHMIYGASVPFDELVNELKRLNLKIKENLK